MASGSVFCSIERLFDWEKQSGEAILGVTLSVAWGDTTKDPPANFLLPWNWRLWNQGPDSMQFVLRCIESGDITKVSAPKLVTPESPRWNTRNISLIRQDPAYRDFTDNALSPQFTRIKTDRLRLGYNGPDMMVVDTADQVDETGFANGARWPSVLADLSTRPAPIPQALLLSFILRPGKISGLLPPPQTDGTLPAPQDCSLFAAPVLPAGVADSAALTPDSLNKVDGVTMFWNYAPNAAFEAQSQMVKLGGAPPVKSFFDMGKRLVNAPGGNAFHFNEDWQATFESRLGERLDLSAALIRALEKNALGGVAPRVAADAAIAALRDVTGVGCDAAPSRRTFLETLGVDKATVASIKAAIAANDSFKTLNGWKTFLQTNLATPERALADAYLGNPNLDLWGSGAIAPDVAAIQLNRLRRKLLTPDVLWALLQTQVSAVNPTVRLTALTDTKTLAAALRAENLGRYWAANGIPSALVSNTATYTLDSVRSALSQKLQQMANARFANHPSYLPVMNADVHNALDPAAIWKDAANYAIPDPASAPAVSTTKMAPQTAKMAPQGVTIQINELSAGAAPPAGEIEDVKKLQGSGLLLSYETAPNTFTGWTCLNYADVYYTKWLLVNGTKSKQLVLLARAVLAPLRFTTHNDVAVATVSYNNEPLPAAGPLSQAAKQALPGPNRNSDVSVKTDLLTYQYPTSDGGAPTPKTTVTPLTFGRDYRPQPFLVSNAGALPITITDGANYFDVTDLNAASGLGNTWSKIEYRRQIGPGPLRLLNPQGLSPGKHLKVPQIPDGVFPRALLATKQLTSDQPLVLLAPDDPQRFTGAVPSSFDFGIRPPSTDLLTWDRFVNGFTNPLANIRDSVFKAFMAEMSQRTENNTPDNTIDDPSTVTGAGYDCRFFLELFDEGGARVAAGFVRFAPPSGTGLSAVQTQPAFLHFQAVPFAGNLGDPIPATPPTVSGMAPSGQLTVLQPGSIITISVPEGRFASLRLHTCVPSAYAARFSNGIFANATVQDNYYILPPTEIFIEVATNALPKPADTYGPQLANAKVPGLFVGSFNPLDGSAPVTLNLAGVANNQYVFGAEVLRQIWKWQGRPVDPLPSSGALDAIWLTKEFGNRKDFLRNAMTPPANGQPLAFTYTEQLGSMLSDGDRAGGNITQSQSPLSVPADARLRGNYIRYGAQVESRYKPLCVKGGYLRASLDSAVPNKPWIWRDLYIPSRKLTQIKPPDVKLVLPLTRNAASANAGPGILILLRGQWYREGGLGEGLEAEITLVEDPNDDPTKPAETKTFYYQYGPDPILSNPQVFRSQTQASEQGRAKTKITGPVGHTFDTVADDQLFVNTSFVLDYPTVDNLPWTPWSFCKLRLRRTVNVIGVTGPAGASDWSQPIWVQLLPDFDRYSGPNLFSDVTLTYPGGNFQLAKAGQPVNPNPGTGDSMFVNYLAVTHFIADVTGVPIQEAYDRLYRQSGVNWISLSPDPGLPAFSPQGKRIYYRARVITVQGKNPTVSSEDDFWDNIFTVDKGPDQTTAKFVADIDRLRIVGISRPIDMEGVSNGTVKLGSC